jgi:homocysteine S-methyltransferase
MKLEMNPNPDPVQTFLKEQGFLILDGGLATELEFNGFDLDDPLWSARLLLESPEAIENVHHDYLSAGADCIVSASYQASLLGFMKRGLTEVQSAETINEAVQLALRVRDDFWALEENRQGRLKPLVAAGVGPYGAYLANGAEFTGDYDLDEDGLYDFHRRRWEILSGAGADLLACETIPSAVEARALARLLAETPEARAWFSFSCRDGERISDGTPITLCVERLASHHRVVAVGVNCTAPRYILSLVKSIRSVTMKPIVVYPNSGEVYDAGRKTWSGDGEPGTLAAAAGGWYDAGARLIGGCCRTRPEHIRRLRQKLNEAIHG